MRILYVSIICFFVLTSAYSQDPSFSQFYANRIYLNPALTGLEPGISVAGSYRQQWKNVDNGFRTYLATAEIQEPFIRSGLGLTLYQDVEGIAQLTTTGAGLSYAYMIPVNKRSSVHVGMQTMWYQKSVDYSKLIFSDQLDPVYGVVQNSTFEPGLEQTRYSDFNIGAVWRFSSDVKMKRRKIRDMRSNIGISLAHATGIFNNKSGGDESLLNLETGTPPRLTVHAGTIIPLVYLGGQKKKEIAISPNIKYDVQSSNIFGDAEKLQVTTYGFYLLYEGIYMGAMYQHKLLISAPKHTNAFIFSFGAYMDSGRKDATRYFVGMSYDANTTGLGTTAGGVFELSFRATFTQAPTIFGGLLKKGKPNVLDCKRLF